ncbi:Oligopeptide transport ATP-binding protein OppD [Roseobacter fucihabitans]|uniref:Oligopeptide transport ATP-binding protein OppD n=1 Tax=Roseobacter fucihabitans TaxID=1537242 RepID=A0ABZ2BR91_9RHOB|nr:ABC transporter ATP-binding protein [Roseobacter litoralis]MBC6968214.1 Oligopeptide transport ATP-binding protein OppD [Roseobacter litoralis]
MTALLEIQGLKTHFKTDDGVVKAVDGVDLHVNKGEVLGIVGESGSGKTITALSAIRLIDSPGEIVAGSIRFEGRDVLAMDKAELTALRGDRISMIFQQPRVCLNPVKTIGWQITELFSRHRSVSDAEARETAISVLTAVGIPDAAVRLSSYPHELSGGQAQRVMIAIALALRPRVLIADEPTTALDVTIQAQIMELLKNLCREMGTALVLVTHDLGVIAEMADRVAVMYAGQIVEQTDVMSLFENPQHPYTQGLLASMPVLGRRADRLSAIPGSVPKPADMPPACRFAPRCEARVKHGLTRCEKEMPDLIQHQGCEVRCWLAMEDV